VRGRIAEMIESRVRQWLREHQGAAYCARCVATALLLDDESVRAAMDDLAPRQPLSLGPCACGATGLSYGWSSTGSRG
jgi:threonine dehydratase